MNDSANSPSAGQRPLQGKSAWLITDGKAGMDVQVSGVADALGLDGVWKRSSLNGIWRWVAPWGPVGPKVRFGQVGGPFGPPWPDVAIATGRAAIPIVRALKRRAGLAIFTIVLQDPRTGCKTADVIWVPEHDRLRGPNVVTTLTAPHGFTRQRLMDLRASVPPEIAALRPGPIVTVILGGKNSVYKFTDACDARLTASLQSLARLGARFLVTPSRRTHPRLLRVVDAATASAPRILWNGEGANPYPGFLAHADLFVVTADSVNMTGEACATGRPVYVFKPSGGSAKFDRFHQALMQSGATRELPAEVTSLQGWSYTPVYSVEIIAAEIEKRWLRRRAMLTSGIDAA
jgi:hypothetical protein